VRTLSFILLGLLLGVCAENASATSVTVNVQAHVIQWVDTAGIFGGQITVGQAITASYTYDSNSIPGMVVQNGFDEYLASAPPAALSVSAGTFAFQSATGIEAVQIGVMPSPASGQPSSFALTSQTGQPLPSGTPVGPIQFMFADSSGHWPTSVALPLGAPAIANLSLSRIVVQVGTTSTQIVAQVDSVALVPPSIQVSPLTGSSFVSQQHFDFALIAPAGSTVSSAQVTAHGSPLPLYPGAMCQLAPANSANRPVVLCPNGDLLLAGLGSGPQQLTFQVVLSDGTTINQSVVWTLIE
jgi:hypothetical protein